MLRGYYTLKIFKPKFSDNSSDITDSLEQLIDNTLPLQEKIINLINHFEEITLKIGKKERLIELILKKLNYDISFSRIGDNNERYDAMIELNKEQKIAIVEVEIPSTAMLDAPRNLLDGVAVYCNRYDKDINKVVPVVFCWAYPNNRTDYWNVINDISKIVKLQIQTISVVALACYYWTKTPFDITSKEFNLDNNDNKLDSLINILEEENIDIETLSGFLSPIK